MKLKQKKNTNYLRLKINYKNSYIHRNLARSHQSRHHTGPTLTAEIPTPGNLKSGVSPFCITPANPAPLLPPISLGHYMFLHEVQNIIIRFYDREGETENWNLLPLSVFPSSGVRVRLHIGYIQKGVLGGTSCFEALINRCSKEVSNEDYYSAQEIMHHLLPLKLTSCSFNVVPINLSGPRRVKVNRTVADITTHDSILGTNSKCQKYASDIMEMNFINLQKISK